MPASFNRERSMNRRGFLSVFALAPVAAVVAARGALAAPSPLYVTHGAAGECFIGESLGESSRVLTPAEIRKFILGPESFDADGDVSNDNRETETHTKVEPEVAI
jgi:hypothetical protein